MIVIYHPLTHPLIVGDVSLPALFRQLGLVCEWVVCGRGKRGTRARSKERERRVGFIFGFGLETFNFRFPGIKGLGQLLCNFLPKLKLNGSMKINVVVKLQDFSSVPLETASMLPSRWSSC